MVTFFFLMIRRPPRSTQSRSSAASDVYKRQDSEYKIWLHFYVTNDYSSDDIETLFNDFQIDDEPVSYTHLRAHETPEHLVCRLLLEKKKLNISP